MIFGLDPLVFGLLVGLAVGAGVELSILWFAGRRWIPNRSAEVYNQKAAAGDLDDARDHFIAPIRQELRTLKADLTANDAGTTLDEKFTNFETRFVDAYKSDMNFLRDEIKEELNTLPARIQMTALSEKGVESKAVQVMMEEQGGEIVAAENMMDALASENPEIVLATAMRKVSEWEPSKKYAKENPGKMLAYEIGKPFVLNGMMKAYESLTGQQVGGSNTTLRKTFTSPYG